MDWQWEPARDLGKAVDRYLNFIRENLNQKLKKASIKKSAKHSPAGSDAQCVLVICRRRIQTNICATTVLSSRRNLFKIWRNLYVSMRHWRRLERRSQNVHKFPQINQQTGKYRLIIPTAKRLGWRLAFGMKTWAEGNDVNLITANPASWRVIENDGRKASGPDPLRRLLISLAVKYWTAGKKTTTLDVHDYLYDWRCGGRRRRRSAMISLSDFDDQEFAIQEGPILHHWPAKKFG